MLLSFFFFVKELVFSLYTVCVVSVRSYLLMAAFGTSLTACIFLRVGVTNVNYVLKSVLSAVVFRCVIRSVTAEHLDGN